MSSSRQLAAIMFTDIVGYTALMGKDTNKALALMDRNKGIQKPLIDQHNGTWHKDLGDGSLASFVSAVDAVSCALEIQKALKEDQELKIRIGIHLGDVTFKEGDVHGDGVNIASRIESIADPGGIYISESVHKAIRGHHQLQSQYLGEAQFKNVDYPVKTFAMKGEGLPVPTDTAEKHLSGRLWAEIKRRNVIRPALVYLFVALVTAFIVQAAVSSDALPGFYASFLWPILGLGFAVATYLAWSFERSPQGFIRTTSKRSWQNPYSDTQKKPLTSNFIIVVLVLVIAGMYAFPQYFGLGGRAPIADKSIAVLYFENMSGDEGQEYFSDGITEEIISHLARITDLRVISRTSVLPYKGKGTNIRDIADKLNVSAVLEGSVRRSGNKIRITAQLINAQTDEHLWTEVYDRELADIFEIQSSVAKAIADKFNVQISREIEKKITTPPTDNLLAYDLYLQALAKSGKSSGFGIGTYVGNSQAAIDLLRKVLDLDPNYAQAMALLSENYRDIGVRIPGGRGDEMIDSSVFMAKEAIIHAPDEATGYIALANATSGGMGGRVGTAAKPTDLKWYQKAYEVDSVAGRVPLGNAYLEVGSYPQAMKLFQEEIEYSPRQHTGFKAKASAYIFLGRADSAIKYLRIADDLAPNVQDVAAVWTYLYLFQGDIDSAEPYVKAYYTTDSLDTLRYNKEMGVCSIFGKNWDLAEKYYANTNYRDMDLGLVLMRTGREDSGRVILEKALQFRHELRDPWSGDYSRINAMLGNYDVAIAELKKLVDEGWHDYYWLKNDPFWDEIRHLPEFKQIEADFYRRNEEMLQEIKEKGY